MRKESVVREGTKDVQPPGGKEDRICRRITGNQKIQHFVIVLMSFYTYR
jgi:hypothetical protein